eukprot:CAMPEP_0197917560 /NCGR_PEP_ID=MMETSP1439-20131203/83999_1 /TAXON_ID=66791 /ORGANISM="Gonyaulax spinifera, Strain CCMP409" /LENGTH=56 /DNA_ID=CAMNT_0043539639 /DNA_START=18 /DNA_END=184 /DNA_ORIENTATION=-
MTARMAVTPQRLLPAFAVCDSTSSRPRTGTCPSRVTPLPGCYLAAPSTNASAAALL